MNKTWLTILAMLALAAGLAQAQPVATAPAAHTSQLRRAAETLTDEQARDILSRAFLTGDWGGARTVLSTEYGITPFCFFTAKVLGNPTGGQSQGAVYNGLIDAGVNIDLELLTDGAWPGATVFANLFQTQGPSLTERYLGDPFFVSNIDAPDSIRLAEAWYQQDFLDHRISLRLGQLLVDSKFAISDLGAMFINGSFGWPIGIGANAPIPAYPVAGLGARLKVKPTDESYIMAAVYQGNCDPFSPDGQPLNNYGVYWNVQAEDGVFAICETGYEVNLKPEDPAAAPATFDPFHRLPGQYKLGAWFHTGTFDRNDIGINGVSLDSLWRAVNPPAEEGNWGLYAVADQMLWLEEPCDHQHDITTYEGLAAFWRFFYANPEVSAIDVSSQFGFTYTGLAPNRPHDTLGVAFAYNGISQSLAAGSQEIGGPGYTYTGVLEVSYQIVVAPWWIVQPDIQYVFQPGAAPTSAGGTQDAIVLSLQTGISF